MSVHSSVGRSPASRGYNKRQSFRLKIGPVVWMLVSETKRLLQNVLIGSVVGGPPKVKWRGTKLEDLTGYKYDWFLCTHLQQKKSNKRKECHLP